MLEVPELYTIIIPSSSGPETTECVCDPLHVCTAPTCIGISKFEISKILIPLNLSGLGSDPAPCKPQSNLPLVS